jgi:hypothetical protein
MGVLGYQIAYFFLVVGKISMLDQGILFAPHA